MMHYNELAPAQPALVSHADRLRLAAAAYLARFKGTPRPRRLRSALLSRLVRRARPGPVPGPAPAPGAVHPVDAGGPPVQALDGVPAFLGHRGVLPDLRHRRRAGALTRRACPPPCGSRRVTDARIHAPAVRGPAHRRAPVRQPERLRPGGHARPAGPADLRSHQRGYRRPRRRTRPPRPAGSAAKAARSSWSRCHQRSDAPSTAPRITVTAGRSCSTATARGWTGTQPPGDSDGSPRQRESGPGRTHPHMLRHTFVTTMLDAGVDLRDVQIAARHADPRTTMRYDRARKNLDRHPNYILAAYMASGT